MTALAAPRRTRPAEVDARALAAALSRAVGGEVRFGAGSRALYANDASSYRQVPVGVVVPRTIDDVIAAVEVCRDHDAPLFARGTGTGLAGQSVNHAVVLDFSKYLNEIVELDYDARYAIVQPGVILDTLRDKAEERDLTYGPDPATHSRCTLGGMIGNNSCGVHSILAGVTADNIEELDVVLADGTRLTVGKSGDEELQAIIDGGGRRGEIYAALRDLRDRYDGLIRDRYPQIPRRISGYNLDRLLPEHGFDVAAALVGTESTCALTLQARCTLIPSPQHRSLVLLGYEAPWDAADHVPEIMEYGPIGLETFDQRLVDNELEKGFEEHAELLPRGSAWLLCEFGGDTKEEADDKAERLQKGLRKGEQLELRLYEDPAQIKEIWQIREGGVGHSKVPGKHPAWPSWEDAAVAPEKIGAFLRDWESLVSEHGLRVSAYFGHVGHGCIHTRLDFDFSTQEGIRNYRSFGEDAARLIASYGGSLSGEHGDGHARAEFLETMFGSELVQAFREFKAIWDPDGRLNPGKVSDPYPTDSFLRFDPSYRPRRVQTHFHFPDDRGDFIAATERCFGVGACREITAGDGVMCPSYRATREEKHSTRGRARLLNEMLRGEVIGAKGWRDDNVHEALDLCLACKGCKSDCPVRVDMATYKAEFFSHYFAGRLRPLRHYALGLIYWEARVASRFPRAANRLAGLGKRLVGIAPERELPQFAERTFRDWWVARGGCRVESGRRVLLWPDTFNNFFHPETAIAAVEVLEDAGCRVELPGRSLCCGRPLYDFGMLTLAKRLLRQILDELRPQIAGGVPVVGLEPSCLAVFRDELVNLFPDDVDAQRLRKQSFTLAEYLGQIEWEAPRLEGKALVQAHCHHKSVLGFDKDRELLERTGLDVEVLESGCCGMAGSFGYEAGEKYEVSMRCAEDTLLPRVRDAGENALLVADGFSCRSQIEHGAGRRPRHLAEVLRLGLVHEPAAVATNGRGAAKRAKVAVAALAGTGLLAGGTVAVRRRLG
ncbi:MAG TPA: FAD-linked oxidase C-terminal domain-containing protein [Gaiellaceae bacterium]